MKHIKRITLRSGSGYCCIEDAYTDRLTVTAGSVRYEYVPYSAEFADKWGWSYRSTASTFRELFGELEKTVPGLLADDEECLICDGGMTELIVTYEDGTRAKKDITHRPTGYDTLIAILRRMIPLQNSAMPMILREYDEEEE